MISLYYTFKVLKKNVHIYIQDFLNEMLPDNTSAISPTQPRSLGCRSRQHQYYKMTNAAARHSNTAPCKVK